MIASDSSGSSEGNTARLPVATVVRQYRHHQPENTVLYPIIEEVAKTYASPG
jgi:hypothetical protein